MSWLLFKCTRGLEAVNVKEAIDVRKKNCKI